MKSADIQKLPDARFVTGGQRGIMRNFSEAIASFPVLKIHEERQIMETRIIQRRSVATLFCIIMMLLPCPQVRASDTNAEFAVLCAQAEKGDVQSQFELGVAFYSGKFGVAKDTGEALKWIRKAAEQNAAPAQYNLGVSYEHGDAVTQDYVEAVKWYRKAAHQNWAEAQNSLGNCYANGQGVAKDDLEAVTWYRKAAEQNLAVAQYNLGNCYKQGDGVQKDEVEAVKWYRKAAEQDLATAQHNLGVCYERGYGVARDYVESAKWYRKAAEQNHPGAQCNLGSYYFNGQGVTKSDIEAYKWSLLAAGQGVEPAQQNVAMLERQLTPEQRAAGQQSAAEFKPTVFSQSDFKQNDSNNSAPADLLAKAEAGDAQAQNELGEAFYAGRLDVKRDPVAAVKWFRKAAERLAVYPA